MIPSRRSILTIAVGVFSVVLARSLANGQSAGSLPARSSRDGGVQVVVKPKNIAAGAPWEFELAMNTHIKPLSSDPAKAAVLIDGNGRRYEPIAWQGDPPGGHHRKGILRFPAPTAQTKSFEVQLEGIGGVPKRVFKWTMN
jgi:hypothetical protein